MKNRKIILALLFVVSSLTFFACGSGGGDGGNNNEQSVDTIPQNSNKVITAFSLNGVTGTINETAKTIAVIMPSGTNVTALVGTFTTTGASVKVGTTAQKSGVTANDFTNPVIYTVTATDGSTVNYTVTVSTVTNKKCYKDISISVTEEDKDNNGTIDFKGAGTYSYTYNVDGQPTTRSSYGEDDKDNNGTIDSKYTHTFSIIYNADKNILSSTSIQETKDNKDVVVESRSSTRSYTYDANGKRSQSVEISIMKDNRNGDGVIDLAKYTVTYDGNDNEISSAEETDMSNDGTIDFSNTSTSQNIYDSNQKLISSKKEQKSSSLSSSNQSIRYYENFYTYDDGKRTLTRTETSWAPSDLKKYTTIYTYTYNSNGNRLSYTYNNNGTVQDRTDYTYDSNGNLVQDRSEGGLSSKTITTNTYTNDSDGNRISTIFEVDDKNDGVVDRKRVTTNTYNSECRFYYGSPKTQSGL